MGEVEMLVSLGVMPVGVADVEGYRTWVTAAQLDDGVTDVGLRGEPSVDAIVALEPLLVCVPVIALARRELDLLALDEDTPRVLGVRIERARLVVLGAAAALTATAVSAVGVIGFVGLVAPHAARALVGGRHGRVIPVAALLGGLMVSLADTLGRTVIAPAQIPAGLVTALVGTPYFLWLLWRTRT